MNPQEALWSGEFGDAYSKRQDDSLTKNRELYRRIFGQLCFQIHSAIEFGANRGGNLFALRQQASLYTRRFHIAGVEINEAAYKHLRKVTKNAYRCSILDFSAPRVWDLVLTKGLLIHIHPDDLAKAYSVLYEYSRRYILIAEYFSPRMETIEYRGHDALWKGPYAEHMLDKYPDLKCIDYGFVWKRDQFPQDNLHWFLLEKAQ